MKYKWKTHGVSVAEWAARELFFINLYIELKSKSAGMLPKHFIKYNEFSQEEWSKYVE